MGKSNIFVNLNQRFAMFNSR